MAWESGFDGVFGAEREAGDQGGAWGGAEPAEREADGGEGAV